MTVSQHIAVETDSTVKPRVGLISTCRSYMSVSFAALGVPSNLVERLKQRGIHEAFPIQEAALPDALAGRDVVGKAATGSGKTLAFGLPLLARLGKARSRSHERTRRPGTKRTRESHRRPWSSHHLHLRRHVLQRRT